MTSIHVATNYVSDSRARKKSSREANDVNLSRGLAVPPFPAKWIAPADPAATLSQFKRSLYCSSNPLSWGILTASVQNAQQGVESFPQRLFKG